MTKFEAVGVIIELADDAAKMGAMIAGEWPMGPDDKDFGSREACLNVLDAIVALLTPSEQMQMFDPMSDSIHIVRGGTALCGKLPRIGAYVTIRGAHDILRTSVRAFHIPVDKRCVVCWNKLLDMDFKASEKVED